MKPFKTRVAIIKGVVKDSMLLGANIMVGAVTLKSVPERYMELVYRVAAAFSK